MRTWKRKRTKRGGDGKRELVLYLWKGKQKISIWQGHVPQDVERKMSTVNNTNKKVQVYMSIYMNNENFQHEVQYQHTIHLKQNITICESNKDWKTVTSVTTTPLKTRVHTWKRTLKETISMYLHPENQIYQTTNFKLRYYGLMGGFSDMVKYEKDPRRVIPKRLDQKRMCTHSFI